MTMRKTVWLASMTAVVEVLYLVLIKKGEMLIGDI